MIIFIQDVEWIPKKKKKNAMNRLFGLTKTKRIKNINWNDVHSMSVFIWLCKYNWNAYSQLKYKAIWWVEFNYIENNIFEISNWVFFVVDYIANLFIIIVKIFFAWNDIFHSCVWLEHQ